MKRNKEFKLQGNIHNIQENKERGSIQLFIV